MSYHTIQPTETGSYHYASCSCGKWTSKYYALPALPSDQMWIDQDFGDHVAEAGR